MMLWGGESGGFEWNCDQFQLVDSFHPNLQMDENERAGDNLDAGEIDNLEVAALMNPWWCCRANDPQRVRSHQLRKDQMQTQSKILHWKNDYLETFPSRQRKSGYFILTILRSHCLFSIMSKSNSKSNLRILFIKGDTRVDLVLVLSWPYW